MESVSDTVPVKPFSGDTVIVELPTTPVLTVRLVGFAAIWKSGAFVTWKVTVAE